MSADQLIRDCILDLRVLAVQLPQALEVSQAIVDRLYKIKDHLDALEGSQEGTGGHFGRPVVVRTPPKGKTYPDYR